MDRRRDPSAAGRYARVPAGGSPASRPPGFGRGARRRIPLALLVLGLVGGTGPAGAEEGDLARDLGLVSRPAAAPSERLAAARRVLEAPGRPDPDAALTAALALLPYDAEVAGWLALRGTDAGVPAPALAARLRTQAAARAEPAALALAWHLGAREPAWVAPLCAAREQAFVRAVLEREVGRVPTPSGAAALDLEPAALAEVLEATRPAALALDQAVGPDAAEAFAGLSALRAAGPAAAALLRHEVESALEGGPPGRTGRAARAALLMGVRRDPGAPGLLGRALKAPDGWVRAAAAIALGDLGAAAGAVDLAWHLATLGDDFRARDQWEWPGTSATDIPAAEWGSTEYYSVDALAAGSLLALGVPGALGYLLHEKLDPLKAWHRIRVLQDALDAVEEHAPWLVAAAGDAPYGVDQGGPLRRISFERMAWAWHARRHDPDVLARRLDEEDPGFRAASDRLAARLAGESVRERMIARAAAALLGPRATPALVRALGAAEGPAGLLDLLRTLGDVEDPRAVAPLVAHLAHASPAVRGAAAEALGAYAYAEPEALEALLAAVADPREEARSGALRGLVGAPRRAAVAEAVADFVAQAGAAGPGAEDRVVLAVIRFVQEGEGAYAPIAEGLASPRVYVRRTWWDLLRRALDLPVWLHDPVADPGREDARRLDRAAALRHYAQRHGP